MREIISFAEVKHLAMKIKFEIRTTKKVKESEMAPLYVRMVDGRAFHQAVKMRTLVNPNMWDKKGECIKSRVLCTPEERERIDKDVNNLRSYLLETYNEAKKKGKTDIPNWLAKNVDKFYSASGNPKPKKLSVKVSFDELYDKFLSERKLGEGRKRHYEVLRRMIHRYESYAKCSQGRVRYSFDVVKVDKGVLDNLYDYIENEYEYVETYPRILEDNPEARDIKPRGENYMSSVFKEVRAFFNWAYKNKIIDSFSFEGFKMPSEQYGSPVYLTLDDVDVIARADFSDDKELEIQRDIFAFQCNVGCRIGNLLRLKKRDIINGAVEYIPTKTIKERAKTVVVPLNAIAMSIVEKYKDVPGDQLLPFISSQNYNKNIKTILEKAGITYLVTKLDSVTRTESKVPINEMANSHMARRTFIGNIYKLVKAPNLISALTGHAEGSRAFNRYRDIDIDMKRDLVKILEGKR